MDANTLRGITIGISGRKLDPVLEAYLPQYVGEINAVIQKMRDVAREFPPDLEPAPAFFVRSVNIRGF